MARVGTIACAHPNDPAQSTVSSLRARVPKHVARLSGIYLAALIGFALFDRGFAFVKPAGAPTIAEPLLFAAIMFLVSRAGRLPGVFRRYPHVLILLTFIAWGAIRMLTSAGTSPVAVVRDAALWGYAIAAIFVLVLLDQYPRLMWSGIRSYLRFVPLLLCWWPFAALFARSDDILVLPDGVSLLSAKSGNTAVHALMAIAIVGYFGHLVYRRATREILILLGGISVFSAATQARGALLAAVACSIVLVALSGRVRPRILASVGLLTLVVIGSLAAADVRVTTERREISARQFITNTASVLERGQSESGNLGSTAQWRSQLWTDVIAHVQREGQALHGVGFGGNMGDAFLPQEQREERALRSPHNSHLSVWVRMGWIGAGLWIALWGAWFYQVGSAALRTMRTDNAYGRLACIAAAAQAALLINAIVDPTLESPQAALWCWTLYAVGLIAARRSVTSNDRELARPEADPRRELGLPSQVAAG